MPDLAKSEMAGDVAWDKAKVPLQEISRLLAGTHDGRTFVLGGSETPSFGDFILAGYWRFLERVDQDGDLTKRIMLFDQQFGRHRVAMGRWLERDD